MGKYFLFIMMVLLMQVSCTNRFADALKAKDLETKLKTAEFYYAKKQWGFAQQLFEQLCLMAKGTEHYENIFYKAAYSYYYDKSYENAENLFKTFVETFPNSRFAEEAEYMRAYSYYKTSPKVELDQTGTKRAMALMQSFINGHPTSPRNAEANKIIDACREKLEEKDFRSALLYYNMGFYKAAAVAFNNLYEEFPDSKRADEFKLLVIKSYYKFAELSYETKQQERFKKVITECTDFAERFIDSKLLAEVNMYKQQSINNLKLLDNEQNKKADKS